MIITLACGAGFLIGCVGIGGVVLVPALLYLADVPIGTAIAATIAAFLVSGIVGTYAFARAGAVGWRLAGLLAVGALPGAFVGARLVALLPTAALEAAIAILAATGGLHALLRQNGGEPAAERRWSPPLLVLLGAGTGLLSAATGTGGPLVLVPLLVALDTRTVAAVGAAQVIQLPIAAAATAANVAAESLDMTLALTLAAGLAVGTWAGAAVAQALRVSVLRSLVAVLLVLVGGAMLLRPLLVDG